VLALPTLAPGGVVRAPVDEPGDGLLGTSVTAVLS
jgi:hypothetical protein